MGLNKTQSKEYAETLYLDTSQKLTNKEIADRVGVRPNTIGAWIEKFGWNKRRKSLMVTRKKLVSNLYDQLEWLNDDIINREVKVATSKESDSIAKITNAIERLETETSIAEVYEVATQFLEFVKPMDFEQYKRLIPLFDAFINTKLG